MRNLRARRVLKAKVLLEHRKVSVKVRTKNIEEMKNKWEKGNYEIGVMIRKKRGHSCRAKEGFGLRWGLFYA